MAGFRIRSFDAADEVRTPDKTKVDVVDFGDVKAARLTLQPGWRWSECIKPVVGGDSCQGHHVGVLVSGTMHVVSTDGTESDVNAGDACRQRTSSCCAVPKVVVCGCLYRMVGAHVVAAGTCCVAAENPIEPKHVLARAVGRWRGCAPALTCA